MSSTSKTGQSFLVDLETGDIYMDPDGNIVSIEGEDLAKQTLDILLHTNVGDDILISDYGIDLMAARDRVEGASGQFMNESIITEIIRAVAGGAEPLFVNVITVEILSEVEPDGSTAGSTTFLVRVKVIDNTEVEASVTVGV